MKKEMKLKQVLDKMKIINEGQDCEAYFKGDGSGNVFIRIQDKEIIWKMK